jgi:hypothetical protein
MASKAKRKNWTPPAVPGPAVPGPAVAAFPGWSPARSDVPKRGLIAVLLVFSALCFGMFFSFRSECGSTVDALRAHGAQRVAFVAKVVTNKYNENTMVDVSFKDARGAHQGRLCIPAGGSLSRGLTKGSVVVVVYDTRRPSQVMLASQVKHPPGWSLAMVITLAGGILFFGLGVAVFVRRRLVLRGG